MPRLPRQLSTSQIYHVITRGNERKNVFGDDKDREKFLNILNEKKANHEYYLYAYCLMGNHIHLLLKEGIDSISRTMGRINTSYARYFNKKYNRVGHVFQDRYKSEAVEQETYLLTLIRYIHNNPVKAKIVTTPSHYKWSSYNEYMGGSIGNILVEKSEILSLFSEKDNLGLQYFVDFHCQVDNTSYLEVNDIRLEKISTYIAQFFKIKGGDIETLNKKPGLRKELIDYLLDAGYSIRSISQELNVDRGVVQRLSNKKRTFLGNST